MAEAGIQETAPLVHDGVMFLQTNNNIVEALDAKTGDLIWQYRHVLPQLPTSWSYQINRARRQKNSIALYRDKVILTTADAKIVVLNAADGKVAQEKQVIDYNLGYSYTVGPLIADGKIITAISGCSIAGTAGGCYIFAHDVNTGDELWRFNTIDDPNNRAQQDSWGGVPAENRWGGTPWTTGAYDPETKTTFWGIGMHGPYSELIRGSGDGSVLYTNSTLALDVETGTLKWYYQHLPRDNWDLDSPFERILVDRKSTARRTSC
ncbi:PQQ-binding-like beta-propeller repeat protein [Devosia sp. A8/3-2]|nr:PQQ-binding-like beta-propeller repeat protein [Devosia sp. A8/3-2]